MAEEYKRKWHETHNPREDDKVYLGTRLLDAIEKAAIDTYQDERTLEGWEWANPISVGTAGAIRTVEGVGTVLANTPVVAQGLQAIGKVEDIAAGTAGSITGSLNLDPRFGGWTTRLASAWYGGKAITAASKTRTAQNLSKAAVKFGKIQADEIGMKAHTLLKKTHGKEYTRVDTTNAAARRATEIRLQARNNLRMKLEGAIDGWKDPYQSPVGTWASRDVYDTVTQSQRYIDRYGGGVQDAGRVLQMAYDRARAGHDLTGMGRQSIGGRMYRVRKNTKADFNPAKGTGYKLVPVVNIQAEQALRRSWQWNSKTKEIARNWFKKEGFPELAEDYIKYVEDGNEAIRDIVKQANVEIRRTNPNIPDNQLMTVGHGKSLKNLGPDVPNNKFMQQAQQNFQKGADDLPDTVIRMARNPVTLVDDMDWFLRGEKSYMNLMPDLNPVAQKEFRKLLLQGWEANEALDEIWRKGGVARESKFFKPKYYLEDMQALRMSDKDARYWRWSLGDFSVPLRNITPPYKDVGKHGAIKKPKPDGGN